MDYATACQIPRGGVQWNETRRAFFSGIFAVLGQMRDKVSELDQDKGVEQLQGWVDEIRVDFRAYARANGLRPGV